MYKVESEITVGSWSLGPIWNVRKLETGLINDTYVISTPRGKFILQMLGKIFTADVVIDQAVIAQYLRMSKIVVPELVITNDGLPYAVVGGRISKLSLYIDHDENPKGHINREKVRSAATLLARFHRAAASICYRPKHRLPHFHDTKYYLEKLGRVAGTAGNEEKAEQVSEIVKELQVRLPDYFLKPDLPAQLIHGDPKLDNFLFVENSARGLIDLDTFMIASVLIDLGDALRSWMRDENGKFEFDRFDSALEAYRSENPLPYSDVEVLRATVLISLELATRFLIDYFEESYFKWDSGKYQSAAEHNLARSQYTIRFADSIGF